MVTFSHLSPADADLADVWDELSPTRRREVISNLVTLAEADAQLDFTSVFRDRLDDADEEVRALAVGGLWECEDASLIPVLTRLLNDDVSTKVQAAATQALGKFSRLVALGNLRQAYRAGLAETLLQIYHDDSRDPLVRSRALEAVAPLPLPEVADAIREAFHSDERHYEISALYAMGASCDTVWQDTLTEELDSPDAEIRYEATTALGEIGEESTLPLLQTRLTDADPEVRLAAVTAIGKIGGDAAGKVLGSCRVGDDAALSDAVAEALGQISSEDDPMHLEM
jgi:HEAT repeat protein